MDFSAGFAIRRNEKIIQQDSESIENIDGFRNPSKRKQGPRNIAYPRDENRYPREGNR